MYQKDIFGNCKSGKEFETKICGMLMDMKLDAKRVGNNDKGVDIIATTPSGYTFNIQCKFYNKPIGNAPINEVFGGTNYYKNGGHPVVITNNAATAGARLYAKSLEVEIIADAEWIELEQVFRTKRIINQHQGLMGMIVSCLVGNTDYLATEKADNTQTNLTPIQQSRADQLKSDLQTMFDRAKAHIKESTSLLIKANQERECAITLIEDVLVRNIDVDIKNILSGGLSMSMLFDEILNSLDALTPEQKSELRSKLAQPEDAPQGQSKSTGNKPACPACKGRNIKKMGFTSAGVQRYQCKDCKNRFTETSDTMLFRSKLTPEQWDGMGYY